MVIRITMLIVIFSCLLMSSWKKPDESDFWKCFGTELLKSIWSHRVRSLRQESRVNVNVKIQLIQQVFWNQATRQQTQVALPQQCLWKELCPLQTRTCTSTLGMGQHTWLSPSHCLGCSSRFSHHRRTKQWPPVTNQRQTQIQFTWRFEFVSWSPVAPWYNDSVRSSWLGLDGMMLHVMSWCPRPPCAALMLLGPFSVVTAPKTHKRRASGASPSSILILGTCRMHWPGFLGSTTIAFKSCFTLSAAKDLGNWNHG